MTAPPAMVAGITRSGSEAANGMAPSEMNDRPNNQADLPFSCSAAVNRFLRSMVAIDRAIGGIMPAPMTAAMIFNDASSPVDRPAVANR